MRLVSALIIITFCVKISLAQKVSFLYTVEPNLTRQFNFDLQQYAASKPQLPVSFNTHNSGTCSFDGFGFNGQPQFLCTCNNLDAAKTIGTHQLWPGGSLGLSLNGAGLNKLALWDGGSARLTHIELTGRVQVIDTPSAVSSHTTAVTGNLVATGINPLSRGMAYQTQLRNWNFSNDNAEIIGAGPSLLLSNHSYGSTAAWITIGGFIYWYGDSSLNQFRDWKFGYYDNRSRIWDSVMYANPYYLMVKAAGNDRGNGVAPGTTHYFWNGSAWALTNTTRDTVGPYDCIATFGNAKNILTIGAANVLPNGYAGPSSVSVLSFSSWGPTDDGRIKPDLVAASGSILSVGSASDSSYASLGGTSMSAPNVTGSLLLLQQYYQQLKNKYMRNATLKTLAIHTADRCKTALGPNYECGWGLPNMPRAALCISDSVNNTLAELTLNNNDTFTAWIYVNSSDTVKTTIGWTDPKGNTPAPVYNDPTLQLVNDLDMRLLNSSGGVSSSPFVLNPANPALAATTGDNFRDNIEQFFATGLSAGFYKIRVTHKNTLLNSVPQKFALALSGANCEPLFGSGNIILSNILNNQMRVMFTKGNGQKRIVIARATSIITNFPVNGNSYTANSVFGSGQNIGNNTYVVYNDTGNQFLLTGLNPYTIYNIAVIEYNGTIASQTLYTSKNIALNNAI
ncbi:MAG: S8 family serine peptidase, partial [Bacteroidia bacterium]|nr:S8 family serine peptidase [Bacteroidia bacterium]